MPFTNPIVAGLDLIRRAIRSPNFLTGVSGWSINRDGTAEFNDVTVRGDLRVDDPTDNSYLRLYHEDTDGVVLELRPEDDLTYGAVTTPARLRAANNAADGLPGIALIGPDYDNEGQASLFLGSGLGSSASLQGSVTTLRGSSDGILRDGNVNLDAGTITTVSDIVSIDASAIGLDGEVTITSGGLSAIAIRYRNATSATVIAGFTNTIGDVGTPVVGFTFTAPPSGAVFVTVGGVIIQSTTTEETFLGFQLGSGTVAGSNIILDQDNNRCIRIGRSVTASAAALLGASRRLPVSGLTPGNTYWVRTVHWVTSGGNGSVECREITIEPAL